MWNSDLATIDESLLRPETKPGLGRAGSVWNEHQQNFHFHTNASSERQAKFVSHSWNERRTLCVQKHDGSWQDDSWFMRAARITLITQPRCFKLTRDQSEIWLLTFSWWDTQRKLYHFNLISQFPPPLLPRLESFTHNCWSNLRASLDEWLC